MFGGDCCGDDTTDQNKSADDGADKNESCQFWVNKYLFNETAVICSSVT